MTSIIRCQLYFKKIKNPALNPIPDTAYFFLLLIHLASKLRMLYNKNNTIFL